MKQLLLMVSLLVSGLAYGAPAVEEDNAGFYLSLYPAIGAGIKPMADGNQFYGTAKVFPVQYGLKDIGFSLLGVGYSAGSTSGFTFSPVGLRALNWMVSMDIQHDRADFVGVSLNYYLPLDFP